MKTKLVKIGNSTGIRLPKNVIKSCSFQNEIDLIVRNNTVILKASENNRENWQKLFQEGLKQKPIQEGNEWKW